MKKPSPAAVAPVQPGFWRPLALWLLVVAMILAVLVVRQPSTSSVTDQHAVVAPKSGVPVALPRELVPYAALGTFMADNSRLADLGWTKEQFAAFQEGFRSSYEGRGVPLDDAAKKLRDEVSQRVQAMMERERPNPVQEYFKMLTEKEGVKRTPSGLHYRITEEVEGDSPRANDTVVISFAARLPDGQSMPALSKTRTRVAVQDLLPGLAEGVQLLKVGGKALLYLPPGLSFSEKNWPSQLPKGMPIAFFVELHDVIHAP